MTDWLQSLISGFGRAVQTAGANQRQQEKQAEQATVEGGSMSGFAGVAAALGFVANNASSTNTEQLRAPMTISGRLDMMPDTAVMVLQNGNHIPAGGGAPVPAIVARLVPGRVWDTASQRELLWTNASYSGQVPCVYWDGRDYQFVPTSNQGQPQRIIDFNDVRALCRPFFGNNGTLIATNLQNNAPTSGHYYVDLVFTQQPTAWAQQANPNVTIVRAPFLTGGRRDRPVNAQPTKFDGSNVGAIYHLWDTALIVNVTWPIEAGTTNTLENSGAAAGAVAAIPGAGGAMVNTPLIAFSPSPRHSGMVLQGGNFVAGLFMDKNVQVNPRLLAPPAFVRAAGSRIYRNTNVLGVAPNIVAANTPLHFDLLANAPTTTGNPPVALTQLNFANAPAAVAINTAQPATLILSRLLTPIAGPWAPQGGTFPVGGGTFTPVLPPTTVYADGVQARPVTPPPGALQPNEDYFLTIVIATGVVGSIRRAAAPAGTADPPPPAGSLLISKTTTDGAGVIASQLLLPRTLPLLSSAWIESFSIPLGNLNRGEMNRVSAVFTQGPPNTFQVAVTINDVPAVPVPVAIAPIHIQIQ